MWQRVDGARGGHADHHEEQVRHGEVQDELRESIARVIRCCCGQENFLGDFTFRHMYIQRSAKKYANLTKQDLSRARQKR